MSPETIAEIRKYADETLAKNIDSISRGLRSDVDAGAMIRALRSVEKWTESDLRSVIEKGALLIVSERFFECRKQIVKETRAAKMRRAN
jgi:hypothetical protein